MFTNTHATETIRTAHTIAITLILKVARRPIPTRTFLTISRRKKRSDLPAAFTTSRFMTCSGHKAPAILKILRYGTHGSHFSPKRTSTSGLATTANPNIIGSVGTIMLTCTLRTADLSESGLWDNWENTGNVTRLMTADSKLTGNCCVLNARV